MARATPPELRNSYTSPLKSSVPTAGTDAPEDVEAPAVPEAEGGTVEATIAGKAGATQEAARAVQPDGGDVQAGTDAVDENAEILTLVDEMIANMEKLPECMPFAERFTVTKKVLRGAEVQIEVILRESNSQDIPPLTLFYEREDSTGNSNPSTIKTFKVTVITKAEDGTAGYAGYVNMENGKIKLMPGMTAVSVEKVASIIRLVVAEHNDSMKAELARREEAINKTLDDILLVK